MRGKSFRDAVVCVVSATIALWAQNVTAAPPATDTKDSAGISAMFGRITQAFADKDANAILATCSDEAFLAVIDRPEHPDGVVRVTKEVLVTSGSMISLAPTYERRFIRSWTWQYAPDVAGTIRTAVMLARPGAGRMDHDFVLMHYEQGRWKVCFSFPCFVQQRVIVEEALPDGQGAKLGVKSGDIVLRYAGQDIFAAVDLVEAVKKPPAGAAMALVLRRGDEQVVVQCQPGPLGLRLDNRFEGDLGTKTLIGAAATAHPAAKPLADLCTAMKARDVKGMIAATSQFGYVGVHVPKPDEPSKLVNSGNAQELFTADLKAIADMVKLETLQIEDIRLIIRGNLALASWQGKGQSAEGKPLAVRSLGCLVCFRGKWGLVAEIAMGDESIYRLGIEPEKK